MSSNLLGIHDPTPRSRKPSFAPPRTDAADWERARYGVVERLRLRDHAARGPSSSSATHYDGDSDDLDKATVEAGAAPAAFKLDQWKATSISAVDMLASILFIIGLQASVAGPLAPISLLLVTLTLYPYRFIMCEVCSALPFNGGSYSVVLNAAPKWVACAVGISSLLSYVGTNVISAVAAMEYLAFEFPKAPVFLGTFIVIAVFALVALCGVRESSTLTIAIFALHAVTLAVVMTASAVHWSRAGNTILAANWAEVHPLTAKQITRKIFDGYCVGMLGVTGFETTANFVQELRPGVFAKTIRNMWWMLVLLNAPIMLLVMANLPLETVRQSPISALSLLAMESGGKWLRIWMSVDAVIVMCAGTLTAYQGVLGLVSQLAADRILPSCLLIRNKWTHVQHWVILGFLFMCAAVYASVLGDAVIIGEMYAVAFLGVMMAFAGGSLLLKYQRPRLPRDVVYSTVGTFVAFVLLLVALIGNLILTPAAAFYFFVFFAAFFSTALLYMNRANIARLVHFYLSQSAWFGNGRMQAWTMACAAAWTSQPVVYLTRTDNLEQINKAVQYVRNNESTRHINIVHMYTHESTIPRRLLAAREVLDEMYSKVTISIMLVEGEFSPSAMKDLSRLLGVPQAMMFLGCPSPEFPYTIGEFDGLRIIML